MDYKNIPVVHLRMVKERELNMRTERWIHQKKQQI